MSRLLSFSQSGIRRPQRANAVFKAEVPAEFVTALAEPIFVHVDVEYPIPDTLDQFVNALPITAAHPCPYCGRYPGHHDWCGRPNVRVSFHPKKLIGLDGTWHATGSEA